MGSFLIGAFAFAVLFIAIRIPAIAYVAVHELTHALFGLLCFSPVRGIHIAEEEGSVEVAHPNMVVMLAPYFFPLPAVALLLLFGFVSLFVPLVGTIAGAIGTGLVGAAWGFHFCFTLNALLQRQTDLDAYGFLFSVVLIAALNLLFLLLAFVALSSAKLGPTLADFGTLANFYIA